MKAVVLAAGEGRRLEPLTNRRPKPMVPIANRPLLEYVVEAVAEAGIDEIVLVVGYKRERIQTYFGDGNDWDVSIEYAVQDKQLGTGHAVLQAEPFVDDDFVVLNGDRIVESSLVTELVEAKRRDGTVMGVTRSEEPSEYGVVTLDGERVVGVEEKPHADETESEIINAGVYGFEPSVFDDIRATDTGPGGELAITATIERLVHEDSVRAVRSRGLWVDVSYLWDAVSVNASVLDRQGNDGEAAAVEPGAHLADAVHVGEDTRVGANATVRRGTSLGDNVSVGANAVLSNAVVLPDADVGDGAVLRDCVVGENARIGANVTVEGGDADVIVEGVVHEGVTLGGVVGDNADLGGGTILEPGTVVGDGARVASGTALSGRVPPNADVRRS